MDFRADRRQTHSLAHTQAQTLSPRLQHAVRLLQMSSLDFATLVREKLGQNPFLEGPEGDQGTDMDGEGGDADSSVLESADGLPAAAPQHDIDRSLLPLDLAQQTHALSDVLGDGAAGDDLSSASDDGDSDREIWNADLGAAGPRGGDDGEGSAMDTMAVQATLAQHLEAQLQLLPLPERDFALARLIAGSLDDDGYLRTDLEELQPAGELDPDVTLQEMQIALRRVQSLDPAGVGARSVAECLTLQLPGVECPRQRELAQRILADHLQHLATRDVQALSRKLGVPPALAEAVCDRIRRLDPRPGWRYGAQQVPYVVPDVLVRKVRGQWTVTLNPAVVPRVRLNQVYAQLFQRHRMPHDGALADQLQDARWTVRNVDLRFSTIVDVAQAIVRRQHHFLDYGAMAMKPLGLREIAEEVGIHESTVSRVTNNKYMDTPMGVFELKHFFSRALISANGSACSGTAIRGLIKDIIGAEDCCAPLSDADITRQLAQQGLVVARRTVTKYRQMLQIEAVERRRRVA